MVAFGPETMVINYSERFTVTEMTGLFSSPRPIKGVHGHGDLRKKEVVGEYTIPYQLQTGLTRYAPMAKKPGSTIPGKSSPVPQFPASAYDIATTYLPAPKIQTTISASRTYSVVSVENTASPAPHPHDIHMKRFLERWKD
ncbi:putative beta-1,6-glucan biosynthesis protein (Knh1) [Aspergillus tanneri]|uniref:Yeast cell wall synthesis Kre9/Knh1 C-terminal domain-containing protein n=1 Tax=Aspergillus tanneri TaxID=1220188 RepID=A0A5M9MYW0_9EURO|nr:uncharacterized protein ATNIH1004_001206 [Aspergillus tanneri]KAA8652302.1 hypothetical protein ATNIH1004_001206 [Aspergillus tanneri]